MFIKTSVTKTYLDYQMSSTIIFSFLYFVLDKIIKVFILSHIWYKQTANSGRQTADGEPTRRSTVLNSPLPLGKGNRGGGGGGNCPLSQHDSRGGMGCSVVYCIAECLVGSPFRCLLSAVCYTRRYPMLHIHNPIGDDGNRPATLFSMKALESTSHITCPLWGINVPAGFPSPARDYVENSLDLNELMVANPVATYFVRVEGYSMSFARILPGDILVVDRSVEPCDGHIVIAVIDGDLTVKRLRIIDGAYWLFPENDDFQAVKIEEWMNFSVWGVVMWVVHRS